MEELSANDEPTTATALVVEDDPALLELLAGLLQAAGFTSTCCTQGQAALAQLGAHAFDLLLLELWLPDVPGFAVCQAARERYGAGPIVILLTADQRVSSWVTALDLGADDCVGKPFDPEELLARIRAKRRRAAQWVDG